MDGTAAGGIITYMIGALCQVSATKRRPVPRGRGRAGPGFLRAPVVPDGVPLDFLLTFPPQVPA